MFKNLNNKGYNLMELIVVIIIIGVLIAMAVPKYLDHKKQADLAVIQNDSKVVQNVAMTEYMSTDKLPKGEQGSPDELIEDLDKQLEAGKIFKNGFLIQTKEELGPKSESQGGEEFKIASNKIKDFYLLDDTWVRAKTKSALPGRFLLDADFNAYYVAENKFGLEETDKSGENDDNQEELIKETEKDLADLQKDADNGKSFEDVEDKVNNIEKDIGEIGDKEKQKELQDELDKIIVELKSGFKVKQVALGQFFSAAIDKNGDLYTWGNGYYGKLGHEDDKNRDEPTKVDYFSDRNLRVKQVALGREHSAAITEDGNLYTWGNGENGRLGHGKNGLNSETDDGKPIQTIPKQVEGISNVKQVALGREHSAAITDEEDLYAWGKRGFKLGHKDNDFEDILKPTKVVFPNNVKIKQVALGRFDLAAIDEHGSLYVCEKAQAAPEKVEKVIVIINSKEELIDIPRVEQVALEEEHSAIVTENGDIYTWGGGRFGRLGHGVRANQKIPKKVEKTTDYKNMPKVKQVSLGVENSAVVTEDGYVYTWGGASSGRLGYGDEASYSFDEIGFPFQMSPKKVEGISNISQIALGYNHAAAIDKKGNLWTWGHGYHGELGHGDGRNKSKPIKVKKPNNSK